MWVMKFGETFKTLRKQNGFTQKQVAAQLKMHQSNVSDWETNTARPEYENLIKLAILYDVTIEELLGLPESFPHDTRL